MRSVYTAKRDWIWLTCFSCVYSPNRHSWMCVVPIQQDIAISCACISMCGLLLGLEFPVSRFLLHLFPMWFYLQLYALPRYALLWEHVPKHDPPPSCPRLRRTISCLAPMLPSMASSSLAFMSLDFLKVRLFIRSNAFFPCMVNTTWALYPWGRRGWVDGQRKQRGSYLHSTAQHSTQQAKQVSSMKANVQAPKSEEQTDSTARTGWNARKGINEYSLEGIKFSTISLSPHSVAKDY